LSEKHPISIQLGQKIRSVREGIGLSQEKLAFESGLDRSFISHAERGSRNITVLSLCRIAKALKTSPEILLKDLSLTSL